MTIEELIDGRLDAMLAFPEYWGGAEAFELQVLLLLELRQFVSMPLPASESLRAQADLYSSFLRARYPDVGAQPLSAAGYDVGAIADCMKRFKTLSSTSNATSAAAPPPSAPLALGLDVIVSPEITTLPRTPMPLLDPTRACATTNTAARWE